MLSMCDPLHYPFAIRSTITGSGSTSTLRRYGIAPQNCFGVSLLHYAARSIARYRHKIRLDSSFGRMNVTMSRFPCHPGVLCHVDLSLHAYALAMVQSMADNTHDFVSGYWSC